MAVILELQYGKKIGLPEFSSHNFSVSLKTEIPTSEDIPEAVERVYRILQESVDQQIIHPGYVPGSEVDATPAPQGKLTHLPNPGPGTSAPNGSWRCSPKQRELILKLVDERNLDRNDVDDQARQRFNKGVVELNKLEASGLIDELKVLGLKTPSTPNLHIGKAVHAGLEAFHVARWREEDSTTPLILEAYHSAYRALEDEDPVDYGDKEREECLATGERVVRAYLDSELAADPRHVLGVEVYLRAEDPSMPLPLLGVLDLVREGNVPVDFKTIGSTPDLAEEAWANQLQLSRYALPLV